MIYDNTTATSALVKRGQDHYQADIGRAVLFVLIAAAVPPIGQLFAGSQSNQVIRVEYRILPGGCVGPAITRLTIPAGTHPTLTGDQTEHPLEPQIAARFLETITRGTLRGPGGAVPSPAIPVIDGGVIETFWDHPLHNLGQRPAIGSAQGDSPSTAQDRFMGAFGSTFWPQPLLPTDRQINGPKGQLFGLHDPIALSTFQRNAENAVASDTVADADILLQSVRIGSAIVEYMNDPDFISRFILVRNQVRTQLGYIEADFAGQGWDVIGLTRWWDVFLDDFMEQLQTRVRTFTDQAIAAAFAPFNEDPNGQNLNIYQQIITALRDYYTRSDNNQGVELDWRFWVGPRPP